MGLEIAPVLKNTFFLEQSRVMINMWKNQMKYKIRPHCSKSFESPGVTVLHLNIKIYKTEPSAINR